MSEQSSEKASELLKLLNYPMISKTHGVALDDEPGSGAFRLPSHLPILPLNGVVVFPMTAMPLRVGQSRSVRLIDDAVLGKRLIGLVTVRNREAEEPGPNDVYRVGTVAAVQRLFKSPDGTITLIVHGLLRMRIDDFVGTSPYLTARVSAIPEKIEVTLEVEALRRIILDSFRRMNELSPTTPEEMGTMILGLEDPLQIVYSIADQMKKMDLEDAQRLLEIDSVTEKMRFVLTLLTKELEVLELGRKIQSEAQSGMEKTQR